MLCVIYARTISGYFSNVCNGESDSKAPKPFACLPGLTSAHKAFTRPELRRHIKIKHDVSMSSGPVLSKRYDGDRTRSEVPLSRCQSQETNSPPALDSADERVWGAFLDVRTPKGHSTPVIAEEIDLEAFTKTATLPHIIHSPSRIVGVSRQTQEANRPSDTGPLGGAMPIPDLEDTQIHRRITNSGLNEFPSLADPFEWITGQGHLLASGTSKDIQAQNGAMGEELLPHSTLWGTPSLDTVSSAHPGIARSCS